MSHRDVHLPAEGFYAWMTSAEPGEGSLGGAPLLLATLRLPVFADHSKKVGAPESSPVHPGMPSPASVRSDPQMPAVNVPTLASRDPPVNVQAAMAVLRDLRQQIQAGLELARSRHPSRGLELHSLAGRRRSSPWKPPDVQGSFWKSPEAPMDGLPTSKRAGSLPAARRWSPVAEWESYPHRTWAAPGRDTSFQRCMSPTEGLNSFPQRPWSASARQASCPPKTWAFHGRDPAFQRPGSPPERWVPILQQSWSASAGQAWGPQRARTASEDLAASTPRPWSPLERPSQPTWRPWSASFTQGPSPLYQGRGPLRTPLGAKLAWPRPSQGALRNAPEKENEVRTPRPCPKPRGALGPLHSSESLREFMRQKTVAWRRQALEEKASAMRSLELRNQRLQDAHRKQREAVLGRAVPVVSQTTPGIVTFVPHAAQSRVCGSSDTQLPWPPWGFTGTPLPPSLPTLPGRDQPVIPRRPGTAPRLRQGLGSCGWAGADSILLCFRIWKLPPGRGCQCCSGAR